MSKEEARKILENWLSKEIKARGIWFTMPVYDCTVKEDFIDGVLTSYTFRGLMKIAYNLQDEIKLEQDNN